MFLRVEDMSASGHAAADLGMIWGCVHPSLDLISVYNARTSQKDTNKQNRANANVVPVVGWALMYIIADASLTKRILEEISPCFVSSEPDSVDLTQLSNCTLLQSVLSETLRLKIAVFINRVRPLLPLTRFIL
jgi:hypothetical protein